MDELLSEKVDVSIGHASEVTNQLTFYVDVDLGRGIEWIATSATTELDRFWQTRFLSRKALVLIAHVAKLLDADPGDIADVVGTKLSTKLWLYENWFNDEEEDRQRLAAEEAA